MLEHEYEPEPGLPQALPDGERMLWRGKPEPASLVMGSFHVRKLALYFAVLLVLRLVFQVQDGASLAGSLGGIAGLALLAAIALGLLTLYARLAAKGTVYTITNRRVVIRCGVAVPVTINLPFSRIETADLRMHQDGSGDIAILPEAGSRVSWILLWPFVKPWRLLRVRPILRAVPEAGAVARVLSDALAQSVSEDRERRLREAAAMSVAAVEDGASSAAPLPKRRWCAYPTVPLAAAVSLVVLALVAVTVIRVAGIETESRIDAPVVAAVELYFEDREDGSVVVRNAATGTEIDVLEPGSNGFLRSTVRSFVRGRRAIGADDEQPFSLRRTEAGHLLFSDPVTGTEIDLWAFGHTNAEAFGRFLTYDQNQPMATAIEIAEIDQAPQPTAAAMNDQEAMK